MGEEGIRFDKKEEGGDETEKIASDERRRRWRGRGMDVQNGGERRGVCDEGSRERRRK